MSARFMPPGVRFVPLIGVLAFLSVSMVLFFAGPFNWPLQSLVPLALFLTGAIVFIVMGFLLGVTAPARSGALPRWRVLYAGGAITAVIVLFPSAYIYTGRMPWEVFAALADQGGTYLDFQNRLTELDGQRGPIVLLRLATHWAIYAVIPLAILRWSVLRWFERLLLVATIGAAAVFSILRATDQGLFDLFYVLSVSIFILGARYCVRRGITLSSLAFSGRGLIVMVFAIILGFAALFAFVERKALRFDGNIETVCAGEERQVCVDPSHSLSLLLPFRGQFALGMATAYMSSGYYGLGLSLDRDFQSTFGVGHSPALTRVYESLTGDRDLYENSFTFRLREDAWSDRFMWSTLYTWIANDVGFPLTLPIIGLLACAWGAAWRDAVRGDSDAAAIVFCMLTQTFLYSPANPQLLIGFDTYAALVIWLVVWRMTTRQMRAAGS